MGELREKDVIGTYEQLPLTYQFRSNFFYTNIGYATAGE
jgi:hypothetical protein